MCFVIFNTFLDFSAFFICFLIPRNKCGAKKQKDEDYVMVDGTFAIDETSRKQEDNYNSNGFRCAKNNNDATNINTPKMMLTENQLKNSTPDDLKQTLTRWIQTHKFVVASLSFFLACCYIFNLIHFGVCFAVLLFCCFEFTRRNPDMIAQAATYANYLKDVLFCFVLFDYGYI